MTVTRTFANEAAATVLAAEACCDPKVFLTDGLHLSEIVPGREATLRKVGDRLILEPVRRKSLLQVLAAMTPLAPGDEFPDVDETLAPLDEDPFGTGATSARR